MTISQMTYIVAVQNEKNFSKAAESCFVTQPTLSMQIQKLEEELDIVLFDRSRKPVIATEAGEQLIQEARAVLQLVNGMKEMAKSRSGVISGDFRLGIIPTVAAGLLPLFVSDFLNTYPEVNLIIDELQTDEIVELLLKNQLDAGIVATPLDVYQIEEKTLYYEHFIAFIPDGHRLAEEKFVLESELELSDMLLLKKGHCMRNNVIHLCREVLDVQKKLHLQSGSLSTLVSFSKQGFGMTLIPYLSAVQMSEVDRLQLKPFAAPAPSREVGLIYNRSQAKQKILEALQKAVLAGLPPKISRMQSGRVTSPKP